MKFKALMRCFLVVTSNIATNPKEMYETHVKKAKKIAIKKK
jgi:hypothetical protein